jgi:putative FmdB family regulatory protein
MPFYEYQCRSCGYLDEVLQKVSDKPLTQCPACGKNALRKLMSAPVFRLKGSGWYETDFKSDKDNKRNLAGDDRDAPKSDAKDASKDAAKDTAKTDGGDKAGAGTTDKPKDSDGKRAGRSVTSPTRARPARAAPRKASGKPKRGGARR